MDAIVRRLLWLLGGLMLLSGLCGGLLGWWLHALYTK